MADRRRGPGWIELSVALAALVVSVASLFVARHQARVMDRQLEASVWPLLEAAWGNSELDGTRRLVRSVRNSGVGPLRVRSFQLFHQGRPMGDLKELLGACCAPSPLTLREFGAIESYVQGRVIGAGEDVPYLRVPHDTTRPQRDSVYHRLEAAMQRNDVTVRACYCSVFDDCWVYVEGQGDPAPVRSCAAEAARPQYRSG